VDRSAAAGSDPYPCKAHAESEAPSPSTSSGTQRTAISSPASVFSEAAGNPYSNTGNPFSNSSEADDAKSDAPSPSTSAQSTATSLPEVVSSDSSRASTNKAAKLTEDRLRLFQHIEPFRKHAHHVDDLGLLSLFVGLCELTDVHGETVRLLLRVLKFLHLCDYSSEEISVTLAHASVYFVDAFATCGSQMGKREVGNVLATLIYIAHCYVLDETCPLRVWHKHLFKSYCTMPTLDSAVVRLLQLRCYHLRLRCEELQPRFDALLTPVSLERQQH